MGFSNEPQGNFSSFTFSLLALFSFVITSLFWYFHFSCLRNFNFRELHLPSSLQSSCSSSLNFPKNFQIFLATLNFSSLPSSNLHLCQFKIEIQFQCCVFPNLVCETGCFARFSQLLRDVSYGCTH